VIAALGRGSAWVRVSWWSAVLPLALVGPASGRSVVMPTPPAVGEMTAIFAQPSYAEGQSAQLHVVADADRLTVQPISALPATGNPLASIFGDRPVGPARVIAWRPGAGTIAVHIGGWPSGIYFVRVRSGHGTVVAPVVVRPDHLGTAHVAVVVPTFSWQAYNRRDGDTWYACTCVHTVDLTRPYLDSGVPYNFKEYDRGFFAWLARTNQPVDVIADEDLNRFASGAQLRRLYRMIVFEGHGEYATSHMFDVTEQYRDLGGHLAFLSANQFFRDVVVTGRSMTLIGRFRDLGRPEAALIGSQYIDWNRNLYPDQQYVVRGANKVPWLFAGTGLRNGSHIRRNFGVEIDGLAPSSPPHTVVVADIRNIFPRETAQMTYYTTRAGAEVFNAGTINFGGSALVTDVSEMLSNLWSHMAGTPVVLRRRDA
jgi:N,N-dimethylformamidase beta subunit-like, C-terminal